MSEFILTDENYYSREADIYYMSCSQYQRFLTCEAEAMAYLWGLWEPSGKSDALLQGQYFHSALESDAAFEAFCNEHFNEIFKIKETKARGVEIVGKYAPFVKLDEMLEVVRKDPLWAKVLAWPGQNELFMTGQIGGVNWRMKMDKYAEGRRIIDYKTSANLRELYYNPETKERESFVEHYGYMMRAAVYGEIERQTVHNDDFPTFLILGISKQEPPDREAIMLNDDPRWELELERVKKNLIRIQRLKEGHEQPRRCCECEYCRKTKIIKRIKRYTDLMPAYRNDPDNVEYDDYGGKSLFDTQV